MRALRVLTVAALALIAIIAATNTHAGPEATFIVSAAADGSPANGKSDAPVMTPDGRYIVFASVATNLTADTPPGNANKLFVRDTVTDQTEYLPIGAPGLFYPDISNDGRYVAFYTAQALLPADTNAVDDVYLYDRTTGVLELISVDSGGQAGSRLSYLHQISGDGRYVVFESFANLDAAPEFVVCAMVGCYHVYVRDRLLGTTAALDIRMDGYKSAGAVYPSMSDDGRFVAFASADAGLVPGDSNNAGDIFLYDLQTGVREIVSLTSAGLQSSGSVNIPQVSADGQYVVFQSYYPFVPDDTNGAWDLFLRDRSASTTTRVTLSSDGQQADGTSSPNSISDGGRYVSFISLATTLVPADYNNTWDIFVRDRDADADGVFDEDGAMATTRVNYGADWAEANGSSTYASVSWSTGRVAFSSVATNLVAGDINGFADVFVRDTAIAGPSPTPGTPPPTSTPPPTAAPTAAPTPAPTPTATPTATATATPTPASPTPASTPGPVDSDGDGYSDSAEAGTPLCGNNANDDGVVFGGSDDGVADDGCPGGPAQVGEYSEGQFNIGSGDQDPCGGNGWPAELVSGGASANMVNLQDLASFVAPIRRLNASPGQAGFSSRWDLVPGHPPMSSSWITLQDMATLVAGPTAAPPMLGGPKVFNGPVCPWAP